jgi:hypothetical protein
VEPKRSAQSGDDEESRKRQRVEEPEVKAASPPIQNIMDEPMEWTNGDTDAEVVTGHIMDEPIEWTPTKQYKPWPKPCDLPKPDTDPLGDSRSRPSTPMRDLLDIDWVPRCVKRQYRMTLDEELKGLGKTFDGTSSMLEYDMGKKLGEGTFGLVTFLHNAW